MKWQQFKAWIFVLSVIASCWTIFLIWSAFLSPAKAKTASDATMTAVTAVMNTIPVLLFIGTCFVILVIGYKVVIGFIDIGNHFFETKKAYLEGKRLETDIFLDVNRILLPEGHVALIGPPLQAHQQLLIPRSPRIQHITEVKDTDSQQDKSPLLLLGPYTLSSIPGWMPVKGQLFLARTADRDIIIKADEAWHIALAGPTGGGKSNALMQLAIQTVPFYQCYMVNPHWAPVEEDGRDWRPIQQRLAAPVIDQASQYEDFFQFIIDTMEKRKIMKKRQDFSYVNDPIFISIDEYPSIVAKWKAAPEVIGTLLREARKYYIFLIMCSTDLLLSTIGGNSGARECYRTAFGFKGDNTTMGVIVDDWTNRKKDIETSLLGREGRAVLRSAETPAGEEVRVPLVDKAIVAAVFSGHVRTDERQHDLIQDETDADKHPDSISMQSARLWTPSGTQTVEIEKAPSYALGLAGFPGQSTGQVEKVETNLKSQDTRKRPLSDKEKDDVFTAIVQMECEGTDKLTTHAVAVRAGLGWYDYELVEAFALSKGRTLHRTVRTDGTETLS